jgi:hypothetical protein
MVKKILLQKALKIMKDRLRNMTGKWYGEPATIRTEITRRGRCNWAMSECGSRYGYIRGLNTSRPYITCASCKKIIGVRKDDLVPHGCENNGH